MTKLKVNILANLAGRGWAMVLGVLFIPFYLRFLGIEAYGLVGFFAMLQSFFGLMDFGIGLTLNREMARLSALEGKIQEQRDLLRTLETIYWSIALLIAVLVIIFAPLIAHHWVNPQNILRSTVESAIKIMGLIIALQFPFSFYQGGLMGLQKQVLVNVVLAVTGTLRGIGAIFILWLVSPTIQAFFIWQIFASALGTFVFVFFMWRSLPVCKKKPCFQKRLITGVWRFAAAVSGNAIIGLLLTHLDKAVLSKMLTLEMFGYYCLAGTVAGCLWAVIIPINSALFPRFAQLKELGDEVKLADIYHRSSQFMSVLLLPAAVTIALFSQEIILFWTQSQQIASNVSLIVSVLIIGTALNGLASVPAHLQSAAGWPQLTMYSNLVAAMALVPATVYMVSRYGGMGAAVVWAVLNSGYLIFTVPIMHKRLLKNEKRSWYIHDIGLPFAGVFALGVIARLLLPGGISAGLVLLFIVAAWLLMSLLAILLTPKIRPLVFSLFFAAKRPLAISA